MTDLGVKKLARRRPMAPPCYEQGFRILQAFGLDPPLLGTRDEHRRVEFFVSWLHFCSSRDRPDPSQLRI
jgi:hypothetical protein